MAVQSIKYFSNNNVNNRYAMKSNHRLEKRHYKIDSRFVLDLYTLTYDSHESLDSLGDLFNRRIETRKSKNYASDIRTSTFVTNINNGYCYFGTSFRKENSQSRTRLQNGENLELYFMNEPFEVKNNLEKNQPHSLPAIYHSAYKRQNLIAMESAVNNNGRQRMNRHVLTKMSIVQLQIIINDLLSHVECLNEELMQMLMERDELYMSRDSLLVDIEDLTSYLNSKQICGQNEMLEFCKLNNEKNVNISSNKNYNFNLRFHQVTS